MQKIIITFDETGCPKRLDIGDKYIDDWYDAALRMVFYSWCRTYWCETAQYEASPRPESYPEGRKLVKKIEVTLDNVEHLCAVEIDGTKVYDRDDPQYMGVHTTFRVESRNWGLERAIELRHEFVSENLL